MFKDATLAKDYAQINQTGGFKTAADVINFVNNHDFSTASMSDIGSMASVLAPMLGVSQTTAENMIQTQSFKNEPTTTETTAPPITSKVTGGTTVQTKVKKDMIYQN